MMASFVLFVFTIFLLPVARSANAAQCYECFRDGVTSCTGTVKNCTNEEKCLEFLSKANLSTAPAPIESFARTCVGPANDLTGFFYFNFGDRRILDFTSQVCNRSEADPPCRIGLGSDKMRIYENGKSCPKCYRTGYDNCDADGEVLCVGDLVNCTVLNGEITNRLSGVTIPFAGRGCVSQSVCDLKGKSFPRGTYTFSFKNLQCSKANGALSSLRRLAFTLEKKDLGPQVAFFFPCILGIFAVKILS